MVGKGSHVLSYTRSHDFWNVQTTQIDTVRSTCTPLQPPRDPLYHYVLDNLRSRPTSEYPRPESFTMVRRRQTHRSFTHPGAYSRERPRYNIMSEVPREIWSESRVPSTPREATDSNVLNYYPYTLTTSRERMGKGCDPSTSPEGRLGSTRKGERGGRKVRSSQKTVKKRLKVVRKNLRDKLHTIRSAIKLRRDTSSDHRSRRSFGRVSGRRYQNKI